MAGAKGKAKTASKNNPTARRSARKFFYNEKEVVPVLLKTPKGSSIVAASNGEPLADSDGAYVKWSVVVRSQKKEI